MVVNIKEDGLGLLLIKQTRSVDYFASIDSEDLDLSELIWCEVMWVFVCTVYDF